MEMHGQQNVKKKKLYQLSINLREIYFFLYSDVHSFVTMHVIGGNNVGKNG